MDEEVPAYPEKLTKKLDNRRLDWKGPEEGATILIVKKPNSTEITV